MSILSMVRGDTKTVSVTIGPLGLGAGGITGWSFWMTVKYDPADPDNAAVFQKLPVSWNIQTPGNASTPAVVICNIAPVDTATLPPYQVALPYDVQAKDGNGNIFTVDSGTLTVTADVTIATS